VGIERPHPGASCRLWPLAAPRGHMVACLRFLPPSRPSAESPCCRHSVARLSRLCCAGHNRAGWGCMLPVPLGTERLVTAMSGGCHHEACGRRRGQLSGWLTMANGPVLDARAADPCASVDSCICGGLRFRRSRISSTSSNVLPHSAFTHRRAFPKRWEHTMMVMCGHGVVLVPTDRLSRACDLSK